MLVKWEQGDPETVELWKMMNSWVYAGFDETYEALGVGFDRIYYESQTYLHGKSLVEEGLRKGVFERMEDGSVWCDLTADGLDRKLLLRKDGTSVYITQDLGTAVERFTEYSLDEHASTWWATSRTTISRCSSSYSRNWASHGPTASTTFPTVWWNCPRAR